MSRLRKFQNKAEELRTRVMETETEKLRAKSPK